MQYPPQKDSPQPITEDALRRAMKRYGQKAEVTYCVHRLRVTAVVSDVHGNQPALEAVANGLKPYEIEDRA